MSSRKEQILRMIVKVIDRTIDGGRDEQSDQNALYDMMTYHSADDESPLTAEELSNVVKTIEENRERFVELLVPMCIDHVMGICKDMERD